MGHRADNSNDDLPCALYSASQVRGFDRLAIQRFEIPGATLMERAGQAVFDLCKSRWPQARHWVVLAGTGNNAGDGFVVARLAHSAGMRVQVLQLGQRNRLAGDALLNANRWRDAGGLWSEYSQFPEGAELLVDALLGTGLERPVQGPWAGAIRAANAHVAPCVAVDVPSGLHADTGAVLGEAIQAAATLSFIGLKTGLFTADGPDRAGQVCFDDLGVPAAVYANESPMARRLAWPAAEGALGPRQRNAHKGYFGHVLVIGGNHGMGGAPRLAAEAALRSGAGLVSLATRAEHVAPVLAARPEIMAHAVDGPAQLEPLLRRASVVAIGPGLGQDPWARALWALVRESERPLVVDADALRLLASEPMRRADWVLTPHPGEAAVLLGVDSAAVNARRLEMAKRMQCRFGGSVVLKGAGSIVVGSDAVSPGVCTAGNPGMASGGMGDVLTGVIAGLRAQGLAPPVAAERGVCLHAACGDAAARSGERGLLASDLIDQLRTLVNGR